MEQAKIILTRIDNRLVHGQVGVTWASTLDIDTIVVIDENVVQSAIGCKLMKSIAITANKAIRFYSIDKFVNAFNNTNSNQKLFLVVANPNTARQLVEKGIPIRTVNVGNMHYQRGKVPVNRKMYVDEKEIEDFNYLIDHKVDVYYQDIPGTSIEKISHLVYEKMKFRR